jgi:hypothetical protein
MSKQAQELQKRMTQLSDEQLLEMVTVDSDDYVEEALNCAKTELTARGIDFAKASAKAAEDSTDERATPAFDATATTCLRCGGQMRTGTLVAEKELTVVFTDNQEERFVRVNVCRQCGQLALVADYETDVQP